MVPRDQVGYVIFKRLDDAKRAQRLDGKWYASASNKRQFEKKFRRHLDGTQISFTLRDAQREILSDREYIDTTDRPYRSVRVEYAHVPDEYVHLLRNPPQQCSSAPPVNIMRRTPTPPFRQSTIDKPSVAFAKSEIPATTSKLRRPKKWWDLSAKRRSEQAKGTPPLSNYFKFVDNKSFSAPSPGGKCQCRPTFVKIGFQQSK